MNEDLYAHAGRNAKPLFDYDYTHEYLAKLKGVNYIPTRKRADYKKIEPKPCHRNYLTPLMQTIKTSRPN